MPQKLKINLDLQVAQCVRKNKDGTQNHKISYHVVSKSIKINVKQIL
jgi:hypothetical protein